MKGLAPQTPLALSLSFSLSLCPSFTLLADDIILFTGSPSHTLWSTFSATLPASALLDLFLVPLALSFRRLFRLEVASRTLAG